MINIVVGIIVFAVAVPVFWRCLPKEGKLYRFANTEWEPYVGVAFCSAFALGFTLILSGILDQLG